MTTSSDWQIEKLKKTKEAGKISSDVDKQKRESELELNAPFYIELFSETILQSLIQFYVVRLLAST